MTFTFIYKKGYCFSIKPTKDITFKALILLNKKNLDLNPGTTINWGSTSDKEPTSQCKKRSRLHPWVGTIPWRRVWQPTAHSYVENPMHRGAWRATIHQVTQSQTRLKQLSTHAPLLLLWSLWVSMGCTDDFQTS